MKKSPILTGIKDFRHGKTWQGILRHKLLYLLMAPAIILITIFAYAPMFGILLAFKKGDYVIDIKRAIFDSEWVGFKNFDKFENFLSSFDV